MVTAASLAIILVNAASGTIAYAVQRRISYRTGIFFAAATIPGAQLGAFLSRKIAATWIVIGLAAALAVVGARLILTTL